MDLLRLSLKLDFDTTSKIIKEICKDDKGISNLAQKIYKQDPYNITAFNLVQLQDVFEKLTVIEHENFIIRMSKFEASIYAEEVKELLSKAKKDLNGKYGFEPKGKVFIDFFEDADDFAIRNFDNPN